MAFDPVSTFLAAALYAPVILSSTRAWKSTESLDEPVSVWIETDRPVVGMELETTRLLSKPIYPNLPDRQATLLKEIEAYAGLSAGWDGPRSVGPSLECVHAARAFLEAYPAGLPLPVPMISSSGELGFYWNEDGGYADVNVDSEGGISFFSQNKRGEEIFVEALQVGELSREWFFDKLGEIAAPEKLAA